jgi:hypothetical protein
MVRVTVTNVGDRPGDEVAQLYIHQRHGTASRPVRELKGFERLSLEPGESRTVTFGLGPRQLRYWNAARRDWVVDATEFDVYVGGDSTASLSTSLSVGGVDVRTRRGSRGLRVATSRTGPMGVGIIGAVMISSPQPSPPWVVESPTSRVPSP